MDVTLIASTHIHSDESEYATIPWIDWPVGDTDSDHLAEFAGRACYQSWDRPNPKTATNERYLDNILDKEHYSVLAHASATFYITGVSRSLTHELIRHRWLAFSEVSQRYVDMSDSYTVVPPLFEDDVDARADIRDHHQQSVSLYESLVDRAEARGATRKEARQAARAVLPGGTETKIVVTGNIRAWRDMAQQRWSTHADEEIRLFAEEILRQLREIAPNSFRDFPQSPFRK